jgi:biopolymer transport protein ExbD
VATRKTRRIHAPSETEPSGELNITPYLDVLVNLIMFLLVTQAALLSLGIVDVTAPIHGDGKAHADEGLKLTIGIAREGFFIAAKGGVLGQSEHRPSIPMRSDGAYDYPALTAELRAIKHAFPDCDRVYVAADADIAYDTIVRTLDASREDQEGPLFPKVAFAEL